MRFEEALLSLTRNGQARLTKQQSSKRGIPEPESEQRVREKENEGFLFHLAYGQRDDFAALQRRCWTRGALLLRRLRLAKIIDHDV